MEHIKTLEDFKILTNENDLVIIDFYATWCGPCKMLAPIIEDVANEHPEIKFVKVDTDEAEELASMFNIMSIPSVIYIKNKEVKGFELGFRPKEAIEENIKKYF